MKQSTAYSNLDCGLFGVICGVIIWERNMFSMDNKNVRYGSRELEFAIFCIENVARKLNVDGRKVYDALTEQSDILDEYIIPSYEALHTQSKDYIVDEIIDVMKERGVKL